MLYPNQNRRGDPFSLARSMMRGFDHAFRPTASPSAFPAVNIWQGEDAVAVTAELPGVAAADLEIIVKEDLLTISGQRKAPAAPEGARKRRGERSFGKFSRTIKLPFSANEERVEARFENGVLRVLAGRPDEEKPRKIQINAA